MIATQIPQDLAATLRKSKSTRKLSSSSKKKKKLVQYG